MRGPTEDSRGYGDHVPSLKRKRARRRRSKSTMLSCGCSVEGSLTYEQLLEAQASHCCPDS